MAIKLSTGLRNKLLDTGPLRTIFNLGQINIYNGAAPASADDQFAGTLILVVKNGATGITFEAAAVNGAISKKLTETWSGNATATLQAQYFRLVAPGDTGLLDTVAPRLQGSVALAGADLNLTTINLTNGSPYPIDNFAVSLPAF